MARYNCVECGHAISELAETCPQCGVTEGGARARKYYNSQNSSGFGKFLKFVFWTVGIIMAIAYFTSKKGG